RFYEHNGTGGSAGSRAKIAIDNVAVSTAGPITIITQPHNLTNNTATTATFTVAVTGSTPYYHWRKGTTDLSDGGNISGAGSPTLSVSNVSSADSGDYSVLITNSVNSRTSVVATLTVLDPAINTQPLSRTNLAGDTA